jgi:hypothetical protein
MIRFLFENICHIKLLAYNKKAKRQWNWSNKSERYTTEMTAMSLTA